MYTHVKTKSPPQQADFCCGVGGVSVRQRAYPGNQAVCAMLSKDDSPSSELGSLMRQRMQRQFGDSPVEAMECARPSTLFQGRQVPMPENLRTEMEDAFHADFSGVQLIENAALPEAGACAVASGHRISYAPQVLSPDTAQGREVFAHELSHLYRQAKGDVSGPTQFLNNPALEAQADIDGLRAAAGFAVSDSGGPVVTVSESAGAAPIQAMRLPAIASATGGLGGGLLKKIWSRSASFFGGRQETVVDPFHAQNAEIRQRYVESAQRIEDQLGDVRDPEQYARLAHAERNRIKKEARDMMPDQEQRKALDKSDPILSFEETVEKYMQRGLPRVDALLEIQDVSRTRGSINEMFNIRID